MESPIRQLEPKSLWNNFANLNAVPRASKKEERVRQFMMDFGKKLNLKVEEDKVGNVVIRKPATAGMEGRTPLVFQSHLDMVHQKNADTNFDFETEGIRMKIDGDWVHADGTTLGADNGIGVATIMALLESNDIPHPAFDALFTIDEETGMTGALGLEGSWLEGKILLNLDTEDDNELTIGCAGGVDVTATGTYEEEELGDDFKGLKLSLKGLSGGHSGMDIHKGLGNANKLINRILWGSFENFGIRIATISGGGLRNAVPRESLATLAVPENQLNSFRNFITDFSDVLKNEHATTDPNLEIELEHIDVPKHVMQEDAQDGLLSAIYSCPNGIYRMSPDIADLVQTSNNLAKVEVAKGAVAIQCLTRSSVDSEKEDLVDMITATFGLIGCITDSSGDYPGWQPQPKSDIVALMRDIYVKRFSEEPHVMACHAGLECGILGTNYPEMDMVSFGPNIRGAHSPDEKVQISSVQKYWGFLLETLQQIP